MKKKIFLTALIALTLFTAFACGDKGGDTQSSSQPEQQASSSVFSDDVSSSDEADSSEETVSSDEAESSEETVSSDEAESGEEIASSDEAESSEDSSEENDYLTVTFDSDGGDEVDPVFLEYGEKVSKPTDPSKMNGLEEYEFLGWYYGDKKWDFANDVVTENITLVAKWKLVEEYTKPFLPKN